MTTNNNNVIPFATPDPTAPIPFDVAKQFWEECSVISSDPFAVQMLEDRKLDVERIERWDLARVIGPRQTLPSFASFRPRDGAIVGRNWHDSGNRIIVPLFNTAAQLCGFKGRSVFRDAHVKSANPLGYATKGLVMMGPFERNIINDALQGLPHRAQVNPRSWTVAEGDMDWLWWATHLDVGESWEPNLLVGVFSGSHSLALAKAMIQNVDAPPMIALRQHHDKDGEKYAHELGVLLRMVSGRVQLFRSAESKLDDNKLAQLFRLNIDPFDKTTPFTPQSIIPERQHARETKAPKQHSPAQDLRTETLERAYYSKAFDSAISEVEALTEGERSNQFFAIAARFARFQHTIYWQDQAFHDRFKAAGIRIGLEVHEVASGIDSALRNAKRNPNDINFPKPDPNRPAPPPRSNRGAPPPPPPSRTAKPPQPPSEPQADAADDAAGPPPPAASQRTNQDGDAAGEGGGFDGDVTEGGVILGASGLPVIWTSTMDLESQTAQAEYAIAVRGDVFCRTNMLVRVLYNDKGEPVLSEIPSSILKNIMSVTAEFWSERRKSDDTTIQRQIHPPDRIVVALSELGNYPNINALHRIVKHPVYIDGQYLTSPGYYESSSTMYAPSRTTILPPLPEAPTRADALKAYELVCEVFDEFLFDGDGDAGIASVVSLLLAHVARPMIGMMGAEFVPLYSIDATTPGTGKGTLINAINAITTGIWGFSPVDSLKSTEEEGKRLCGWALSGRSGMVVFDNIDPSQGLGNATIDAVLTSGRIEVRILQGNKMLDAYLDCIFVATGNNIQLRGDLVRRTIPVVLTTPVGVKPDQREFKRDLQAVVAAKRAEILAALLTILRAYDLALKSGEAKPRRAFDSFPTWSKWCRDSLVWLGAPDFVATTRAKAESSDPVLGAFESLLSSLLVLNQSNPLTTTTLSALYDKCKPGEGREQAAVHQNYVNACNDLGFSDGNKWNLKRSSVTLSSYQGRLFGGLRLQPLIPLRKWFVERVTVPPPS